MKRGRKSGEGAQMLKEEWPGVELGHASKIKSWLDTPIWMEWKNREWMISLDAGGKNVMSDATLWRHKRDM